MEPPALQEAAPIRVMRERRAFVAANRGQRQHTPAFVLLVHPRDDGDRTIGAGFTVTKKTGNAVVRNRIKRRFRALARDVLPTHGIEGADHVLIGRTVATDHDFATMRADLQRALARIAKAGHGGNSDGHPRRPRGETRA